MEDQEQYLLELIDIDKSFPGVKALDHARLQLKKGSIHALIGENGAGKSTMMKCLFGIYKKDAGIIRMEGQESEFTDPRHALANGVAMVHQELNQVLRRSVMENIWLGRLPMKHCFVDCKKMYEDTKKVFQELDIDIDPREPVGELSVSRRQMVEIAKAVSYHAKVLVLDEPTSSLTEEEVAHLFRIMKKLAADGVGIIYISHKMDEIKKITDTVTIMRDGQFIATRDSAAVSMDEMIKLMVDRDISNRFPPKENKTGDVLMQVKNLTGRGGIRCTDVSFDLHEGEILGVAGLIGAGRTELLSTIFGIAAKESGEILVHGKPVVNRNSRQAINNGFAMITEERRAMGIFPEMDVTFNSTIANIRSYHKGPLLSNKRMAADTDWVIRSMNVKTPDKRVHIRNLSGGNQQKVIIGRWLLIKPDVLLMDEPTRGIDVGAKYEIYELILNLAKEGKGIVMVSSEMPELLGICDRIMVMCNGRLSGILNRGEDFGSDKDGQEKIMQLAAKFI